jgi:hypothetical protein
MNVGTGMHSIGGLFGVQGHMVSYIGRSKIRKDTIGISSSSRTLSEDRQT